jgi:hypothetical protein
MIKWVSKEKCSNLEEHQLKKYLAKQACRALEIEEEVC